MPRLTTANSTTSRLPDGSFRREVYPAPVNFRDDRGRWRRIDNTMVVSSEAGVAAHNAANDYQLSVPRDASTGYVRFRSDAGAVSWRLRGAQGSPKTHANAATYTVAGPDGAKVAYEAMATGAKESVVLAKAPTTVPELVFDLKTSAGLTPRLTRDREVEFLDHEGRRRLVMPAPFMYDANTKVPATTDAVSVDLGRERGGWWLTLRPDQSWLSAADRVYPVTVDPSITEKPADGDCWFIKSSPDSSYCGNPYIRAGASSTGDKIRSLVRFDLSDVPANATVTAANMSLWVDASQARTTSSPVIVADRVTRAWSSSAASWRTYDGTHAWTTAGGDYTTTGAPSLSLSATASGYKSWNVTSFADGWVRGTLLNAGVVVKESAETTNQTLYFASSDNADQTRWPKLDLTYSEPAGVLADPKAGDREYFTYVTKRLTDRTQAKVNVGNGNLLYQADDLKVAGVAGLDLKMTRYYNSTNAGSVDPAKLGAGWSDGLGGSVRLAFPNGDNQRVYFYGPSGYYVRFERNSSGGYIKYGPGFKGELSFDTTANQYKVTGFDKSTLVFNTTGQLVEKRDKMGNKLTFAYNADGTLASAADTRNRKAVFGYRADGLLGSVEIRDPAGTPLVRYAYDYAGTPGRLTASWLDYVNTTALGDTASTDDVGEKTTYDYDTSGALSAIHDPRENSTPQLTGGTQRVTYTADGRVASFTRATDAPDLPDSTTTYTYSTDTTGATSCNGKGTHKSVVDGERTDVADTTTYCADDKDRVVRTVDANGHKRTVSYTGDSNVATFDGSGLDSGGSSFSFSYDSQENLTGTTTPTGGHASLQYTDAANPHLPTSMRDFDTGGDSAKPATWAYQYDDNGNLIQAHADVTAGKDITYRYCWDGQGNLQRVDPPDAAGASSTALDKDNAAGCGTANQGNDTLYSYDALGQLTVMDPPGVHRTQRYTYDALSRVKTMTDGRGVRVSYSYDGEDRVVGEVFDDDPTDAITPPTGKDSATVTWGFDLDGNLVTMVDPAGNWSYTYDELNRRVTQSQQAPLAVITYTYDPADNLKSFDVSSDPEPTTYTYDAVNLVATVNDWRAGNRDVVLSYDRHDKRTKTVFPMPGGNDLVQAARYGDGGHLKCVFSYRQDKASVVPADDTACPAPKANGLITYEGYGYTAPGGYDTNTRYQQTDLGGVTHTYEYDPITRLTKDTVKNNLGAQLRSFAYTYDRHSNTTQKVVTGSTPGLAAGTTAMSYNDADELCWTTPAASTNGCGTPPAGATTYTYDDAGAITANTAGLTLGYNVIGQNTQATPPGGSAISMSYQGVTQDRRLTKDSLSMSYGFAGLHAQSDNSGTPHGEDFVRDPDGKLLVMITRGNPDTASYYLTDAQESVIGLVGEDGSVRRYAYEPYGKQIRTWYDPNAGGTQPTDGTPADGSQNPPGPKDNNPDANPWRYASGYQDNETGHVKFGTRYIDPTLGRWTQPDPKAGNPTDALSMNPYLYAKCNTVNLTDKTGRYWGEDVIESVSEWDGWDEVYSLYQYAGACFSGTTLALAAGEGIIVAAGALGPEGSLAAGVAIGIGGCAAGLGLNYLNLGAALDVPA